jgi:hypothetical protein
MVGDQKQWAQIDNCLATTLTSPLPAGETIYEMLRQNSRTGN